MVLIQDRILKIDIYNFEMSYKTQEKSLKSNQIYSVLVRKCFVIAILSPICAVSSQSYDGCWHGGTLLIIP